jgi:hypothetical protein
MRWWMRWRRLLRAARRCLSLTLVWQLACPNSELAFPAPTALPERSSCWIAHEGSLSGGSGFRGVRWAGPSLVAWQREDRDRRERPAAACSRQKRIPGAADPYGRAAPCLLPGKSACVAMALSRKCPPA